MTLRALRLLRFAGALSAGVLLLLACSDAHAGQIIDPRAVSETTLPNGLRVVVKEAPSINLVAINVWVRAGSADETADTNGVSHYLEHLLYKGARKRGGADFDTEIEGLGGISNAATMEDCTQYYVVVAKPYLDQAITSLGEVMSNATFTDDDVRREQQIIRDELRQSSEDPERVLSQFLARLAFRQHPYRFPAAGTEESVRKLTRDKILDFYNRYYVAGNMSVVIVGAVKAADVVPKIQAAFAGMKAGPAPDRTRAPEPPVDQVRFGTPSRPAVQRGCLMLGFRAPGLLNDKADVCAMDVLLYILGEERGQAGRLNRELQRKRNLVSAIWGDYVTQREPGLATFWAECDPDKIDTVRDAILEQIAQVRDNPVPEDEIRRAKMLLLGVYTLDNETYDGQASTLGFYEAKDTYEFALQYEDLIQKVTAADIQRVAQKYLAENSYCQAVLRPEAPGGAGTAGTVAAGGTE